MLPCTAGRRGPEAAGQLPPGRQAQSGRAGLPPDDRRPAAAVREPPAQQGQAAGAHHIHAFSFVDDCCLLRLSVAWSQQYRGYHWLAWHNYCIVSLVCCKRTDMQTDCTRVPQPFVSLAYRTHVNQQGRDMVRTLMAKSGAGVRTVLAGTGEACSTPRPRVEAPTAPNDADPSDCAICTVRIGREHKRLAARGCCKGQRSARPDCAICGKRRLVSAINERRHSAVITEGCE